MDDLVANIDFDDTVAGYSLALREHMDRLRAPGEPVFTDRVEPEPPYIEARRKMIQRQPGFWRELEPLPLGFEVVDELRTLGFTLNVLTKGPKTTPGAWTEKQEWCAKHLPDAMVTITQNKALVYGRVLVDDWPDYFTKWLQVRPRGLVICLAHPWNEGFAKGGAQEHPNVLRYDGTDVLGLRWALEAAHGRAPGQSLKQPPFVEGTAR